MIMQAPDSTIFPYTTLFRSGGETGKGEGSGCPGVLRHPVVRLSTRSARFLPLLRQPATARDRPGPGHRTQAPAVGRSEEHTSELQSQFQLVCRLLLEKKKD